jgi:type IV secretory pathway VirJ component
MAIGTITCTALTALALAGRAPQARDTLQQLTFPPFGTLTLYRPAATPTSVVLFVSGDGGWSLGVVGMAERLRNAGALVVGIDVRTYLYRAVGSHGCIYAAADFEALSQFVQRRLGLDRYLPPVLVGYSSGATLVYVALAQSPPNTFKGALSLGFCPDLDGKREWCPGTGVLRSTPTARGNGRIFQPVPRLPAPWIVLNGDIDQVCGIGATAAFMAGIPRAELVTLHAVGHGFAAVSRWGSAFDQAFQRIIAAPGEDVVPEPGPVSDLPLVEVPATATTATNDLLAIMLSGDGGWAGIDREVSLRLAARGIPVVGLNSLSYFWKARSPEELAQDLTRILSHYLPSWHRERVLLLGYSFGADVLPATIAAFPAAMRARVAGVGLMGLSRTASFEFHVSSWLGRSTGNDQATAPALARLPALLGTAPVVCLFGTEETDTGCRASPGVAAVSRPGGHHLGGDFDQLANQLLTLLTPGGH